MPHGREQMNAVARDLANRGFAVWNLEYRRIGAPTGGWPGTFEDVIAGIEQLAPIVAGGIDLNLERVIASGHSAGGHLALWSAANQHREQERKVRISAVVGQAPLADLIRAYELGVGRGAVRELLGGAPIECEERYHAASPLANLPLGVPQLLIHGTADAVVPIEISRSYTLAAQAAGDQIELVELQNAEHMEFLDPTSAAHTALCDWLTRIAG